LATSEERHVSISGNNSTVPPPLSGAGLFLFFQESQSCLHQVTLITMTLSEVQWRVLATMSRLDVELEMRYCLLLEEDAAGAFVECLQNDRGPVKLIDCTIDSQILDIALTGNSRVTKIKTNYESTKDADMAILFTALANNKGLVDLDLQYCYISDENWAILCESLKAHPTLTNLNLCDTRPLRRRGAARMFQILPDVRKSHRTRAIAEMVQHNTVLHTIRLSEYQRDEQIYARVVLSYLTTNRHRPRVHAITKADIPLRRPLLGRALQTESVRNDSNLLWIFLSGNPDVVVQSCGDGEQAVVTAVNA
jgi:hypothetical protein